MKQLTIRAGLINAVALIFFTLVQVVLFAQQEGGSSTTSSSTTVKVTKESTDFWASPWVWVIGGAVFILLLVALLSGNRSRDTAGRTDRVTVTKSVETDV